jgi:putative copper resistance protein D
MHTVPEWLELTSLAFCIGVLSCRILVFTASAGTGLSYRESLVAGMWRLFGICIAAMIASSVANLLMRAMEMSGQSGSSVFPVLPTVIFRSHVGRVWLIRMVALVILSIALKAGGRYRDSRGFLAFMFGITIVISMTESASGHASDKGDFSIPEIMDWLHLLAASLWGGGLFVLSVVILPELVRLGDQAAPVIAGVARRFSRIAGISVGIIVITALYNAWVYVGSSRALWETFYGRVVIAKISLFLVLVNLGAFNRYVRVPLLQEWGGFSSRSRWIIDRIAARLRTRFLGRQTGYEVALRFRRGVRVEAFLMIWVLLCVALLRHEIPARHQVHIWHAGMGRTVLGPEPLVALESYPPKIGVGTAVAMTVSIKDPGGKPFEGLAVSHERILHAIIIGRDLKVFAHIHPEDLGRVSGEMVKNATFPLRFTFPKAGEYLVGIDFATAHESYSKTFPLSVRGQPLMGEPEIDFSMKKDFGEYRVTLAISPEKIRAGVETTLRYTIEKGGKPVTDLRPYLGAAMHLAVVPADLKLFIHAHAVTPGEPLTHADHLHGHPPKRFGPEMDAVIVFPVSGIYKIFGQTEHEGKVLLFDFMVKVL